MWDVANEAIDDRPNSNPFNLRDSFWFRKLGPEFLVMAFKFAHEADPRVELYYNEYGIEGGGKKAEHTLDLLNWLKSKGAPITGLGMQWHINVGQSVVPGDGHYQFADKIRDAGFAFMVTELDVAIPVVPHAPRTPEYGVVPKDPHDLEVQADTFEAVFKYALSYRNCHGINLWGFNDNHSWIPGFSRGMNGAATITDPNYGLKRAYHAIYRSLGGKESKG